MTPRHFVAIGLAAAVLAGQSSAATAPSGSPAQVKVTGRTAVIGLPYRTADKLIWVSATRMSDAQPFMFKGLEIKPHGGPGGMELAVFTYVADKAGTATLNFGLVPPGKMLTGPPTLVYRGPIARKVSVTVHSK